jgi:hypothetical protein
MNNKMVKNVLVILAVAGSISTSTAPADAGPLRDAAKKALVGAKFWRGVGVQFVKCVNGRILKVKLPGCA